MSAKDLAYHSRRIADEHARAAEAPTPEIAAVHEKLAHLYQSLTERLERSPSDQDLLPTASNARHSNQALGQGLTDGPAADLLAE